MGSEPEVQLCSNSACVHIQELIDAQKHANDALRLANERLDGEIKEVLACQQDAIEERKHFEKLGDSIDAETSQVLKEEQELIRKQEEALRVKERLNFEVDKLLKEKQVASRNARGLVRAFDDPYANLKPVEMNFKPKAKISRGCSVGNEESSTLHPSDETLAADITRLSMKHTASFTREGTTLAQLSSWNDLEQCLHSAPESSRGVQSDAEATRRREYTLTRRHGTFANRLREETGINRPRPNSASAHGRGPSKGHRTRANTEAASMPERGRNAISGTISKHHQGQRKEHDKKRAGRAAACSTAPTTTLKAYRRALAAQRNRRPKSASAAPTSPWN